MDQCKKLIGFYEMLDLKEIEEMRGDLKPKPIFYLKQKYLYTYGLVMFSLNKIKEGCYSLTKCIVIVLI